MKQGLILISFMFVFAYAAAFYGTGINGNGNLVYQERSVENFTEIEAAGSIDVKYHVSEENSCVIEADENLLNIIKTKVIGRKLYIYTSECYRTRNDIQVICSSNQINFVRLSGSGNFDGTNINSKVLSLTASGSSNITVSGQVDVLNVTVSGSGDVNANNLVAKSANLMASGSGSIAVHSIESVSASVSGSGDIVIAGHPAKINQRTTGSGSIKIL